MVTTTRRWTLDTLVQEWGYDVPFEVINGVVRQVSPSSADPSRVGALTCGALVQFNEEHHLGEVFGADGGFVLSRDPLILVAPDVSFVGADRIPAGFDFQRFFPGAPDFAAEITSPSDRPDEVEEKIQLLLTAGTRLVWKIDPVLRLVVVYRPGRDPQTFYVGDELDGEDILPGFRVSLAWLFRPRFHKKSSS